MKEGKMNRTMLKMYDLVEKIVIFCEIRIDNVGEMLYVNHSSRFVSL